eukprot:12906038-Prorocentrum_lima.AAC.1
MAKSTQSLPPPPEQEDPRGCEAGMSLDGVSPRFAARPCGCFSGSLELGTSEGATLQNCCRH